MVLEDGNGLQKPGLLLRFVVLTALLLCATSVRGQQQEEQQLELAASSPYSMVLEPIVGKVSLSGLQFLEETIATTLFEEQPTGNLYRDLEAVIQQVDYLQDKSDKQQAADASSTTNTTLTQVKIKFFVLATVGADVDESSSTTPRLELNQLLKTVLVDSIIGKNKLLGLLLLNNHTSLQDVNSVLVEPWSSASTVPVPSTESDSSPDSSDSSSSSKRLTTLDIVLIVASALIFLGILYMILQHHYDRGYIENLRVLAINRRFDVVGSNDDDHASRRSHPSPRAYKHHGGSSPPHTLAPAPSPGATSSTLGDGVSEEAPLTPSTMDSNPQDIMTPERKTPRITNVSLEAASSTSPSTTSGIANSSSDTSSALLTMTPKALLTASSVDGASIQSLSESFDGQWFDANVRDTDNDRVVHSDTATAIAKGESIDNERDDKEDVIGTENNNDMDDHDESRSSGASSASSSSGTGSDSSETSDSTESSEDVFHVDVEAASTAGRSKASSHASATAISEWMKTIRVVGVRTGRSCNGQHHSSSDTKTSDMTHSSHGEALSSSVCSSPPRDTDTGGKMTSSTASLAQTSLDASSLEHRSLEQSMASSSIVNDGASETAILEV
jgi:hypothetical protein